MKTNASHSDSSKAYKSEAAKQASPETILQAYKRGTTQLQAEEEEPMQRKENKTGLPDDLKSGVENLSGLSMDDVKVHYGSSKPAEFQAHAYAQGTDIHVAPGQEKHLPHEAWHVAQQKQGRVKPTMQLKGTVPVNDNAGLEKEADVMGAKALHSGIAETNPQNLNQAPIQTKTVQRMGGYIPAADGPYQGLGDNIATIGNAFANNQRTAILDQNENNAGNTIAANQTDDQTGNSLVREYSDIAAVDHIYPASFGGMNCYRNAQVIDQATNSAIGNTYPKHQYNGARMYMGHAVNAQVPNNVNGNNQVQVVNIPARNIYNINGNGAGATIDMGATLVNQRNDANAISLANARNWGILGTNQDPV